MRCFLSHKNITILLAVHCTEICQLIDRIWPDEQSEDWQKDFKYWAALLLMFFSKQKTLGDNFTLRFYEQDSGDLTKMLLQVVYSFLHWTHTHKNQQYCQHDFQLLGFLDVESAETKVRLRFCILEWSGDISYSSKESLFLIFPSHDELCHPHLMERDPIWGNDWLHSLQTVS